MGPGTVRRKFGVVWLAVACLAATMGWSGMRGQESITPQFPRLDWQPTRAPSGARYAGSAVCAKCHAREASGQFSMPMARAMELPADSKILTSHPRLTYKFSRYLYQIERRGRQSIYSVSDGVRTISAPILWTFGLGEAGQTYVFELNGSYYQSRVSFFNDVQRLGITLGAPGTPPPSLEEAPGAVISPREARVCFACHSTAAITGTKLQLDQLVPGVTCEGCHGAGGEHVAAVQAGDFKALHIFNPGRLNPGDLGDFCGSCHRSSLQVGFMQVSGVETVRFQPYRLANSRCYDPDDARISCLACHDPHASRNHDPAYYDSKCLACHALKLLSKPAIPKVADHLAGGCPVGRKGCVTCHMPKIELPGGHFRFADHWIRVTRAGAPYPN